jgi:hypothetical protein
VPLMQRLLGMETMQVGLPRSQKNQRRVFAIPVNHERIESLERFGFPIACAVRSGRSARRAARELRSARLSCGSIIGRCNRLPMTQAFIPIQRPSSDRARFE